MTELLKELCGIYGVAGADDAIRDCIAKKAADLGAEVTIDRLGNVLAFKKGRKPVPAPVMLIAHMDEAGFKVDKINDDGTALVRPVGNTDPACWLGQRIVIGKKHIPGAFCMPGLKRRESSTFIPKAQDLLLDAGPISKSAAQGLIAVDDGVCLASDWLEIGQDLVCGRAFDSRIGCAVLLDMIGEEPAVDTWFAFTCRDSITFRGSGRGAQVAVRDIEPGFIAFVESREAWDFDKVPESRRNLTLGKGCGIVTADTRSTYNRPLWRQLVKSAAQEGIPYQFATMQGKDVPVSATASNAAGGAASVCLAAPVRYLRTANPVASRQDLISLKKMCSLFIRETEVFHV